jgi:hydroxymethylpyrimidine/phosphomethylpyrimidine kinase
MARDLFPRATLVTPNVDEVARLLDDDPPRDVRALRDAAMALKRATRAHAVLAKGGHLAGDAIDVLVDERGDFTFRAARIETRCTHGTGCTLASAIAAGLANGRSLRAAIADAKALVTRALASARPIGPGKSPLDLTAPRTSTSTSTRVRSRP